MPVKKPNPDHNSTPGVDADFRIELIPVHSLLLGESWLVSFPPLSNMFKFGGSSRLSPALSYRMRKKVSPSDLQEQLDALRRESTLAQQDNRRVTSAHRNAEGLRPKRVGKTKVKYLKRCVRRTQRPK